MISIFLAHRTGTRQGIGQGWSEHVGIVESVTGGRITVIEDNYSDAVKRRQIPINDKFIRGFAAPDYTDQ